jgi:hypothetical protein
MPKIYLSLFATRKYMLIVGIDPYAIISDVELFEQVGYSQVNQMQDCQ